MGGSGDWKIVPALPERRGAGRSCPIRRPWWKALARFPHTPPACQHELFPRRAAGGAAAVWPPPRWLLNREANRIDSAAAARRARAAACVLARSRRGGFARLLRLCGAGGGIKGRARAHVTRGGGEDATLWLAVRRLASPYAAASEGRGGRRRAHPSACWPNTGTADAECAGDESCDPYERCKLCLLAPVQKVHLTSP